MILFKRVRYKNFLSTGNNFTEIDLTRNASTLVVGQNGSGKSTMLDAISFALFGKPHRNINKPQLVNSINQKKCVVEVEFTVNKNSFKIVRGIKPVVFEIWKDDIMINQSSHSKDYQKILEQNILKLNHKSFHQVVVLGSSSFIPFMQLSANHRRGVIEDLLDINVFSKMNVLLKEKMSELKSKLLDNEHERKILETKIESQKKYIRDIEKINQDFAEEKNQRIREYLKEIETLNQESAKLIAKVESIKPSLETKKQKLSKKIGDYNNVYSDLKSKAKNLASEAKFFTENDNCPSCEQQITEDFKETKIEKVKERAKEINQAMTEVEQLAEKVEAERMTTDEKLSEVFDFELKIHEYNTTMQNLRSSVSTIENELSQMNDSSGDLSIANSELNTLVSEQKELTEHKYTLNEQGQYNTAMIEMLKDTGIKTKIIKQYLPAMNKLVNGYLQTLDFFVHFNLDESFNETIKSRHRDSFSYDSFSEGEKQRIDLALLFTWRQIAKMKNSVATNLLILDETFDSSLDADGVENLMKIINTLGKETNVFVISHKGDILDGKFDSKIEFCKEKNFSKINKQVDTKKEAMYV